MLKTYASKKAAIRFAQTTYGQAWQERARYLEVALPDNETLYLIQSRDKPASSRASAGNAKIASEASKRDSGQITKRCQAIFDLMKGKPRQELLAECVRQGAKLGTAATQYQRWRKAHGLVASSDAS